ncbi:unnamed protein product, partial [Rotaria magnacalcarata]
DTIVRQSTTDGSSIDDTVAILHYALNVMKIYNVKYAELKAEADTLTTQLEPLEK